MGLPPGSCGPIFSGKMPVLTRYLRSGIHADGDERRFWVAVGVRSTISGSSSASSRFGPPFARQNQAPGFGGHEVDLLGGGRTWPAQIRFSFRFPGFSSSTTTNHSRHADGGEAVGHERSESADRIAKALELAGLRPAGEGGSEEEGPGLGLSFGSGGFRAVSGQGLRGVLSFIGPLRMAPVRSALRGTGMFQGSVAQPSGWGDRCQRLRGLADPAAFFRVIPT